MCAWEPGKGGGSSSYYSILKCAKTLPVIQRLREFMDHLEDVAPASDKLGRLEEPEKDEDDEEDQHLNIQG